MNAVASFRRSDLSVHIQALFLKEPCLQLPYHNLRHAMDVAQTAALLAAYERLPLREQHLLYRAGEMHDIGYLVQRKHNEQIGAEMARDLMLQFSYAPKDAAYTASAILGTDLDIVPVTLSQQILRDSDMRNLGCDDFLERSKELQEEYGITDSRSWLEQSLPLLENHHYCTRSARALYGPGLERNIRRVQRLLDANKPMSA